MDSEVLRYKVCDRTYNLETGRYEVTKVYHLYWNTQSKVIHINEPIRVSVLLRVKKLLTCNGIDYSNIIIGSPDI